MVLEEIRASSEARRQRILANAEKRLQAIAGGLKLPRSVRPKGTESTTTDTQQQYFSVQDSTNHRPSPIEPLAFEREETETLQRGGSFFKNRVDFLAMLGVGLLARVYLEVSVSALNLFGAYALFALPLLLLSTLEASQFSTSPNLHSVILGTLLPNGGPVLRRVTAVLAVVRTAFEYFAAFLFSFVLVHVFLEELNISEFLSS